MMLKSDLKKVVRAQMEDIRSMERGIKREIDIDIDVPFAVVLSGVRRCGKSTLLSQLLEKDEKCYYLNFEDPRIAGFEISDFMKLNEVFEEERGTGKRYYFDEIQNVDKWEIFVRSMLDRRRKFVITGSNASMLSKELGTRLTGRHLNYELFPFSFREFLEFKKIKPSLEAFGEYLHDGGFPEFLRFEKPSYLQGLFSDIIDRDIIVRHGIRSSKSLRSMALFLLSNTGKEFSYNSLKSTFGLGSTNSAISFVSFLEDAYLLFTLPKFDYSFKKQAVNPKKIYSVDNGLSRANSVSFSDDAGRMLENSVFIELRRSTKDLFYFKKRGECDFLVRKNNRIEKAIQVCYELTEDNKKREIDGLAEAMQEFGLKSGLLLTYDQEDHFTVGGKKILVKPVWKWMTEPARERTP